jgi:malonate decarboxylase beta subunit
MSSYQEANARERLRLLLDAGSFEEFVGPAERIISPHLGQLNAPVAFDDGVAVGRARLGKYTAPSWPACCGARSMSGRRP